MEIARVWNRLLALERRVDESAHRSGKCNWLGCERCFPDEAPRPAGVRCDDCGVRSPDHSDDCGFFRPADPRDAELSSLREENARLKGERDAAIREDQARWRRLHADLNGLGLPEGAGVVERVAAFKSALQQARFTEQSRADYVTLERDALAESGRALAESLRTERAAREAAERERDTLGHTRAQQVLRADRERDEALAARDKATKERDAARRGYEEKCWAYENEKRAGAPLRAERDAANARVAELEGRLAEKSKGGDYFETLTDQLRRDLDAAHEREREARWIINESMALALGGLPERTRGEFQRRRAAWRSASPPTPSPLREIVARLAKGVRDHNGQVAMCDICALIRDARKAVGP